MLQEAPEVPALLKDQLQQVQALKDLYMTQLDRAQNSLSMMKPPVKPAVKHFATETAQEFPDFGKRLDLVEKKAVITPKTPDLKQEEVPAAASESVSSPVEAQSATRNRLSWWTWSAGSRAQPRSPD